MNLIEMKSLSEDGQKKLFERLSLVRHYGKQTNYAATYGAGAATIARSADVSEEVGAKLLDAYWKKNWSLRAIADDCIVKESRGLKWLYNPVSKIWLYLKTDKDRFSTLNQGTASYVFDLWMKNILEVREQVNGQFHDEIIIEVLPEEQEEVTKMLKRAIRKVNNKLQLNVDLDCDVEFGSNYSDVH